MSSTKGRNITMPVEASHAAAEPVTRFASEALTSGIRVQVQPAYLPERSDPGAGQYLFTYHVTVRNEGAEPVMLRSRHWKIIDAHGRRDEVRGEGVVGRQPHLAPGATFQYSSFCQLQTRWGTMEGSFTFLSDQGETVEAEIARFFLVGPTA